MHGDMEDWPVGDEKAGVADLELPKDTVAITEDDTLNYFYVKTCFITLF